MEGLTFTTTLPSAHDFKQLRDCADWGPITRTQAKAALSASLGGVCAMNDEQLIGMARFVGDGVLNIYIQDVVIAQAFRGQGIGRQLLMTLFNTLQENYPADCTIGLMAAKGQDAFYAQFGFIPRPSNVYGAGMIASLGDIRLN